MQIRNNNASSVIFKNTVLVVDDEEPIRNALIEALKDNYNVVSAANGKTALDLIKEIRIDIVLLDIMLPDMYGLDVLKKMKEENGDFQIIMVTGLKELDIGIKSIKFGAYDYLTKPFDIDDIYSTIQRALETKNLTKENLGLKKEIDYLLGEPTIIGESTAIKKVLETIEKVANTPATVLICGESGVGKELVARIIHQKSARRDKPFVAVNCAAIPPELVESELFGHEKGAFTSAVSRQIGKFEYADGGTIFFDDVTNLSLETQAKVLRAIQEREIVRIGSNKNILVDVRIICSTNKELEKEVETQKFREDLYYRLRVVPIFIPPLRKRADDIPLLIYHFIGKANKKLHRNIKSINPDVVGVLKRYEWPGNIRELENVIEMMVVLATKDYLSFEDLPPHLLSKKYDIDSFDGISLRKARFVFEKSFLEEVLSKNNYNQILVAKALGVHRNTIINKMKEMGLKIRRGRKRKVEFFNKNMYKENATNAQA